MKLTPAEVDRLLLFSAAELARKRRRAGLLLNYPESVALISDDVMEAARAGSSFEDATRVGYSVVGEADVLPGVAEMVELVQIEPLFEDGTHLVTLHYPIRVSTPPP